MVLRNKRWNAKQIKGLKYYERMRGIRRMSEEE
jgi:hypothetical protein